MTQKTYRGRIGRHRHNYTFRQIDRHKLCLFVGLFLNVLVNNQAIWRTGSKTERLTILRATTHETELADHDSCLSRSHYTDTDPTSRERWSQRESNPGPPHQESRARKDKNRRRDWHKYNQRQRGGERLAEPERLI